MADLPLANAADVLMPRSTAIVGGNSYPHNVTVTTQNGASDNLAEKFTVLSTDGTSNAVADIEVATRRMHPQGGKILLQGLIGQQGHGSFLGHDTDTSFGFRNSTTWDEDNIAVMDFPNGRFRVDVDGTDYDDDSLDNQLFRSAVLLYCAILLDIDNDKTEFYIEANPFTDDPTATIDHSPIENSAQYSGYVSLRSPGAHMIGNASATADDELLVGLLDVIPYLP